MRYFFITTITLSRYVFDDTCLLVYSNKYKIRICAGTQTHIIRVCEGRRTDEVKGGTVIASIDTAPAYTLHPLVIRA